MESFKRFDELKLPPELQIDLKRLGFESPTPIQTQGIPAVLSGRDLLGIAPTGTGKTGAFGIPAISRLNAEDAKQVLILAPTRELAAQIFQFLTQISQSMTLHGVLLVGGESFKRQFFACQDGVDFYVATPGRLMDHVNNGLKLTNIGTLILDEVDRMLDMGFAPQVEEIVKRIPKERQTLLFSATFPQEIHKLAQRYLKDPERITVGKNPTHAPKIKETKLRVAPSEKLGVVLEQIKTNPGKILIFTKTQGATEAVAAKLEEAGIETAYLHGGRTQWERKRALNAFRIGRVRVMTATDIAARGIDVADIEVVINYDYPATKEDYLHRIGRTGRCGREGVAITFLDGSHASHKSARHFHGRRRVKDQTAEEFSPFKVFPLEGEAKEQPKKAAPHPTFKKRIQRGGPKKSVRFFRSDDHPKGKRPHPGKKDVSHAPHKSAHKKAGTQFRKANGVIRRTHFLPQSASGGRNAQPFQATRTEI